MKTTPKTSAILLSAGMSTRFGGTKGKQWEDLNGLPVIAHTLLSFEQCPLIDEIIGVSRKEDIENVKLLAQKLNITKLKTVVTGGENRQASAKNGFEAVSGDTEYVAIADGARCLTTKEQIGAVCKVAYENHSCACAGHKCADTLKKCDENNIVTADISREGVWQLQTPQVMEKGLYQKAIDYADAHRLTVTDDESMILAVGGAVALVECGIANLKITTPDDLILAKAILQSRR